MPRKIALCLLLVVLSPLIVLVVALAMVLVLVLQVYGWIALRRYCRRHGCWTFLICSSRHGWHDFLTNNVLAALPEGIESVWTRPSGGSDEDAARPALLRAGFGLSKPYLANVTTFRVTTRSLHGRLLPLKGCAKKDAEVQELLRRILAAELTES